MFSASGFSPVVPPYIPAKALPEAIHNDIVDITTSFTNKEITAEEAAEQYKELLLEYDDRMVMEQLEDPESKSEVKVGDIMVWNGSMWHWVSGPTF